VSQRLASLADGKAHHEPIAFGDADPAPFVGALRAMLRIRRAEERIAANVGTGVIKCPCHLAIGQEAAAVGVAMHLRPHDRAFGAHRSHAHFLAMGGSLDKLFAEVLGRDTGASRGMGGSMHLTARESGFYGSVPIVGASIPIAVGAGLAARMDKRGDVAVAFFGDGAAEEGSFHEAMNLAAVMNLPVLFACENNLFASHMHIGLRQPRNVVARFAVAHAIAHATVDGNDVVAIWCALHGASAEWRAGTGGPFFLEAVTYRWLGHVGHRDDQDVGVARKDDLKDWRGRDPVGRLAKGLATAGLLSPAEYAAMDAQIGEEVAKSWAGALKAPFPAPDALLGRVWAHRVGAPR
jgi:pyruvate dehydrogenase E1 component alpha subunit